MKLFLLCGLLLSGCAGMQTMERSYSIEYQGAKVGVTLKPAGFAKQ